MKRTHFLIAFTVLLVTTVCAQAQDPDLLGWWKLDDGTGTVATDSSGNGNDGIFVGDPEWVAGQFGSGLSFDGLGGERVSLGNLDVESGGITLSCWFFANTLDTPGQDPRMISKAFGGGTNDHIWMMSSSRAGGEKRLRFRLKTNDGGQVTTLVGGQGSPAERVIPVGEWGHAAATWDGTTMRVFLNGVETGSTDRGGTAVFVDPSIAAAFGNQPVGAENRPWDGILDDVRIYTKALTSAELEEVMEGPPAPLAAGPDPADGAILEQSWTSLTWKPGTFAVSHDVYFSTSREDVEQGAEAALVGNTTNNTQVVGFTGFPAPEGLQPGTTYYWRVDEINPDNPDSPWEGVVWSFTLPPRGAYKPIPADTMKFVDTNVELTWSAKWNAALYNVYFGTDAAEVEAATGADAIGKTTFDPGPLELETTYYWRVDTFDGTNWYTGDVWSFTTTRPGGGLVGEYANYDGGVPIPPEAPFQNVTMSRIDPGIDFAWGNGSPEPGVIDEDNFAVRWTGELDVPLTGKYTFKTTTDDGVLLYVNGEEMADAWRNQYGALEQSGSIELTAGVFASIKMLYFATSGNAQADLRWEHDSIPEEVIPAAALSPPLRAGLIRPTHRAVNVSQTPSLQWSAGSQATHHDVYFGTDPNAVAEADTTTAGIYQGRQTETSFSPPELDWNSTYYWRVDEVNDSHPDSPWTGPVWSFTTAGFGIVDNFESYNDIPEDQPGSNLVYLTWVDGFGVPTNGSTMGYVIPFEPSMETDQVHSGQQSAPMAYDNTETATFSEVTRTFTSAQDWTANDVEVLTLWFFGDPANTPAQLYLKINGVQVNYNDDAANLVVAQWHRFDVDLTTVNTNLQSVNSMTIGVQEAGATGTVLLDDIRLYRPTP